MSEQTDWKRVHAAAVDRIKAEGWTLKAFYHRAGISETKFRQLAAGEPITRQDKIASLEDGLGWSRGSVLTVADGGEPTIVDEHPAPVEDQSRTDALEVEVGRLTRRVVELGEEIALLSQFVRSHLGREVARPESATPPDRADAATQRRARRSR